MNRARHSFTWSCICLVLLYAILAAALYVIAGDQFYWKPSGQEIALTESTDGAEPLYGHHELTQSFHPEGDRISAVGFKACTYGRENRGQLCAELLDEAGTPVLSQAFDMGQLPDNDFVFLTLDQPLPIASGGQYTLRLYGLDTAPETAASAVYNRQAALPDGKLRYDGEELPGALCLTVSQSDALWLGPHYVLCVSALGILLAGFLARLCWRRQTGKHSMVLNALEAMRRYRFLLRQLVTRDFKAKYKRSVLGVLWSFLNPLLTMTVQYIVFSTVFRNDIQNFPAYLLIGVVFFNFFSESCGMGLLSIIGNAPLITKVYIPKYIFPAARVLSSFINFLLALLPLSAVLLITGQRVTKAFLLLPFSLACLLLFCMGMALLLSAMMVFFRDVQFLWNVISMLWMYATPIFYPETIIPSQFVTLYKMNPLYHFIRFTRLILLDGVSPEPRAYLFCVIAAVLPLLLGLAVFRKTQDRFVLNI